MFNRLFALVLISFAAVLFAGDPALPPAKLDPVPKPLESDPSVKFDYDIVYVRAPRFVKGSDGKERPLGLAGDRPPDQHRRRLRPDAAAPRRQRGSAGRRRQGLGRRPYVSFDAQWVYYAYFHDSASRHGGADIYKVHVKTRRSCA